MKRLIGSACVLIFLVPALVLAEWDIPVREHILGNGMKVLTVCLPDAPVVSFALFTVSALLMKNREKRG